MGGVKQVTANAVLARAYAWIGEGRYKLGAGAPFTSSSPFAEVRNPYPGYCDCSGFVAWCAQYPRGGWSTDAMVLDAIGGGRTFPLVARTTRVRVTDFIVYAGPDRDHDGERDAPGHVGMIVDVLPGFARGLGGWWEQLRVVQCSPRPHGRVGAVRISDATAWIGRGYILRPAHISE